MADNSQVVLQHILSRASKVAQAAEVFHIATRETPAIFEANRLKMLETRETSGVALRIIKDGRIGLSATTRLEDVDGLIDNAVELAGFGSTACLEFPSLAEYPTVEVYDPAVEDVSIETMVHLGQGLIDGIRAANSELLCDGRVSKTVSTISLLNSSGAQVTYIKGVFGVGMEAMLVRGEDMLFIGERESSCHPVTDTTAIRQAIVEQLELATTEAQPLSGSLPVIFTPHGVAGTLLGPLLAGFNGRNVLQGSSPLIGRLGERVVDQRLSIWDDPLLAYVPGSRIVDDEGVPSQRHAIIHNGVATTFLYDLQTACQAGTTSTGSASRSLASLPSPSSSVLVVDEGDVAYEEMVQDVKDGIIVERLLGAGQGNVLAGDFNANVLLGYRISNGKPAGRVKNTMISGNVYKVLDSLVAAGSQARWVGGALKTPALYCRGVSVAAKS